MIKNLIAFAPRETVKATLIKNVGKTYSSGVMQLFGLIKNRKCSRKLFLHRMGAHKDEYEGSRFLK